nr:protein LEG1 homolog [Castor canadensis]
MTLLPSWVWVLAGCLSASLVQSSNLSDFYPPLWKESPGQLSDYKVQDGVYIIDPWIFTDRMGMYKILLNKTATYFAKFAPENEQNILWGLPLQHGWQYKTGRLADPTGRTNCGYKSGNHLCISVDSWWADINYFLSVLPFLAAVDSGIMGISSDQVTLLPPPTDQMRFCYGVTGCRSSYIDLMNKWSNFYQYMLSPSSNFDDLLKYLWIAHTSTLKVPLSAFEDRFFYYSNQEADFGKSWAVTVNYLGAACFPTTLNRSHEFQKGLPPRILVSTDIAPYISDFTALQNIVLVVLNVVRNVDESTASLSLTAWKYLMKTQAARELFLEIFEEVFGVFN